MLNKIGKEQTIDKNEWEWDLRGTSTRPLVVIENVEPAANTHPGRWYNTFKLKLDENWYLPGDILTPGTSNKKYQARVQEGPVRHGKGWVYVMQLMTDNNQDFLPLAYLAAGTRWAKLFSKYGEGAEQSGSTQYAMPISLRNKMSRFRKEYTVTGDVADEVLAVKIPDSNGIMHDSWIKYAEVEYWKQWYRELERGYWYSRSTNMVKDANGRPVNSGPGVQEMLEDSHIFRYSHLTAKLIEDYLMGIFYSRIEPGSKRELKAYTGEYGMVLFSRAMNNLLEKRGWTIANDTFTPVQKASSPYNKNAYSIGYQFVRYNMNNGAVLELIHNPLYDDTEINFEIDPITGYPVESMRFTFLDFASEAAESNIKLLQKKNSFRLGYVAGLANPYGPNTGDLMSHSGNYYEMHVEKQSGVHIHDVTRCGELILSRN
jgi:hypothetical protein